MRKHEDRDVRNNSLEEKRHASLSLEVRVWRALDRLALQRGICRSTAANEILRNALKV